MKDAKRNYGIDGLRIVSMFMIVVLHTLGHGGVLDAVVSGSLNDRAVLMLDTAAYCAVNCFALVSGFVGLRSRFRLSSIVSLWLQVVFYNATFTVIWAVLDGRAIDLPLIAQALQPVKNGAYWYYTAYFGISFLIPLVNAAVGHLDRRTLILAVIGTILVFSVYPTLGKTDIFQIKSGYHAMWLLILYFLGACVRKLEPFSDWRKWIWVPVYGAAVVLTVVPAFLDWDLNLLSYTSPTILLCALALLLLFSRLEPGSTAQKAIALVSPLTFGVYLIHDSRFIRSTFIKGRMAAAAADFAPLLLLKVLGFATAVFTVCIAVDFVRSRLFQLLRVRERLEAAEKSIFRN